MEEISRKDALAQGLKFYFTGVPCANSHISPRRASNYSCLECAYQHSREFIKRQPNYFRDYRRLNQEKLTSYEKQYYRTRKGRLNAR